MIDTAVLYQYFTPDGPRVVVEDVAYPLIRSIATLRGVSPDVPVHVIDTSAHRNDYGEFPERLRFQVWREPCKLPHEGFGEVQGRLLLRTRSLVDVSHMIPESDLLFVDSDIFWFRSPFPLAVPTDRLWTSWRNTGLLWWNKWNTLARDFLETWCDLNLRVFGDRDLELAVRRNYFTGTVINDEAVFCHMMDTKRCAASWGLLPPGEHWGCTHRAGGPIPDHAKNFHAFMNVFGRRRGAIPHLVVELYENMVRGLGAALPDPITVRERLPKTAVETRRLWEIVRNVRY